MDPIAKTTVTMVESSAVTTNPHEKRKFESDPEEEIGKKSADEDEKSGDDEDELSGDDEDELSGDDEYVGTEEEILLPKWWKEPEWDVDSFDGVEYNSDEEEDECLDSDDERKWRLFKRQVIESKGFFVEPNLGPTDCFSLGFLPVTGSKLDNYAGDNQTYREFYQEMACLCLEKYNKQNGFTVEFVKVVRGVYTAGPRWKSYITFMAKEKPGGPHVEYQAKVISGLMKGDNVPILCRPAPPAKTSNKNQ